MERNTTLSQGSKPVEGFDILLRDHEEVESMFQNYEKLLERKGNAQEKQELVTQILRSVIAHTSAKERCVYPLFRTQLFQGDVIADRHILDDQILEKLLQFLEKMMSRREEESWNEDLFDETVSTLMLVLRDHMRREEPLLNSLASKLSSDQLKDVGNQIDEAMKNAPLHSHPGAPTTPSKGASIVQPFLGTMERGMEYLRSSNSGDSAEKDKF
jgi:hemerythrin superfamily protein